MRFLPPLGFFFGTILASAAQPAAPAYAPTWDSIATHPMPEWLLDAKFGIYAHWGAYTVPEFGTEWYPREMYREADSRWGIYEHHLKTYGGPAKFGYKDFIARFRAEKFDPAAWADIVAASGARYAGLAAVHHDGFLLWDSKVSRWNAKAMGPKRDVFGEYVAALRARGLKIVATEHHLRTFNWFLPGTGIYSDGVNRALGASLRAQGIDLVDPAYADLYWNEFTGSIDDFMRDWRAKLYELIDNYQPDIFWFDGGDFRGKAQEKTVLEVLARYHNQAAARGQPVEVLNKLAKTLKFNFPENYGILNYEEGRDRAAGVTRAWIDDMKIGHESWSYVKGQTYKPAREIIAGLIDRTARGGGLMLNLSPRADGTIPGEQRAILCEIGEWLKQNGAAIFATRPWTVQAEGDEAKLRTPPPHSQWKFGQCDATDIRYTRSKDGRTLYAFALGWPADGKLTFASLAVDSAHFSQGIGEVILLGSTLPVKWTRDDRGLHVTLPPAARSQTSEFALALGISLR